jgi:hypothetical protein
MEKEGRSPSQLPWLKSKPKNLPWTNFKSKNEINIYNIKWIQKEDLRIDVSKTPNKKIEIQEVSTIRGKYIKYVEVGESHKEKGRCQLLNIIYAKKK